MIVYSYLEIDEKLPLLLTSKEERARLFDSAIAREGGFRLFLQNIDEIQDVDLYLAKRAPLIALADDIEVSRYVDYS